jgi:hypothetical protein
LTAEAVASLLGDLKGLSTAEFEGAIPQMKYIGKNHSNNHSREMPKIILTKVHMNIIKVFFFLQRAISDLNCSCSIIRQSNLSGKHQNLVRECFVMMALFTLRQPKRDTSHTRWMLLARLLAENGCSRRISQHFRGRHFIQARQRGFTLLLPNVDAELRFGEHTVPPGAAFYLRGHSRIIIATDYMIFRHHDQREDKLIIFTEWAAAEMLDRAPRELQLPFYQEISDRALQLTLDQFRAMVHTYPPSKD